MSHSQTVFVICYDIASDGRRRRVAETLESYGRRVQYSVFRCRLSAIQLVTLRGALEGIIHHAEDQVLFVRLGKVGSRREWPVDVVGRSLEDEARVVHIL